MKQWVRGDGRFALDYDGHKYLFPGAEQMEAFKKAPAQYAPALGGDDLIIFASTGKRMPGQLKHAALYQGRVYLFSSDQNKRQFQANAKAFAEADLALAGECAVCRVDMNQRVPGLAKYTVVYDGLRYQFPGRDQLAAFMRAPDRYVVKKPAASSAAPGGSGSRPAPRPSGGGSGSRSR